MIKLKSGAPSVFILGLYFGNSHERELLQRTYFLDTTPELLHQWLSDKVDVDRRKYRPIGKAPVGEIYLDHVQIARNGILRLWVHVFCEQRTEQKLGPDKVDVWKIGAVIHFKVLPLASERLKLDASCLTPYMAGYYQTLLAEIGECWPGANIQESRKKPVYRLPAPVRQRAPKRKANAKRDAQIFMRYIDGESQQELAREYHVSTERIKQIVREQRNIEDQQAG